MSSVQFLSLIFFSSLFRSIAGFIPHSSIRVVDQAGDSLTHTEITLRGFARSLIRFFSETQTLSGYDPTKEYTVDQSYALVYPTWPMARIRIHTHPLQSILDTIVAENAMVDLNPRTKKLAAAHFGSEAFVDGSRRILKLRQTIVQNVQDGVKDLQKTRELLGQLLHTLQDFYSHSNWVELGKTEINELIGVTEDIGPVAAKDQSTCTDEGCEMISMECDLKQKVTFKKKCPLIFYKCKDNILSEILDQDLLTSGYSVKQYKETKEPISKPTDVNKCSHGSVLDTSSHLSPIGGINKETVQPIYSPHFDLHYQAADFAIRATERFFNDLCKELGNENFDRLFAIHPTNKDFKATSKTAVYLRTFGFLSPSVSSGINIGSQAMKKVKNSGLNLWNTFKVIAHDELSLDFDNGRFYYPTLE